MTIIFAILLAAALAALTWYWRQKRIISRKNRALVSQLMEIDRMNAQAEEQAVSLSHTAQQEAETDNDASLFNRLTEAIMADKLYLDPQFGRQTVVGRFQLSKERVGALFSQSSDHTSITDFVNTCRLNHARQLLADTGLSIDEVAHQSGFGTRQTFSRNFVRHFGLTPTEYRHQMASATE